MRSRGIPPGRLPNASLASLRPDYSTFAAGDLRCYRLSMDPDRHRVDPPDPRPCQVHVEYLGHHHWNNWFRDEFSSHDFELYCTCTWHEPVSGFEQARKLLMEHEGSLDDDGRVAAAVEFTRALVAVRTPEGTEL